ncbi:MAG: outer membrane beta-barrel protein [Xanthobacteraceae bacterium]
MKKVLLAATATATLLGGPAFAADMAVKAAPMAAPAFSWTGFYIGGNVGFGRSSTTFTDEAPGLLTFSGTARNDTFVGGGQIGYNWQFNPNWVVGVEATVNGGKFDQTAVVVDSFGITRNQVSSVKTIWDVAGRFGYANNNWLFYGKGGYAGTRLDLSVNTPAAGPGTEAASSNSVSGFVAGAGIEYGLTQNWIVGVEYDYYGFRNSDQLAVNTPIAGLQNFRSI